ncbi:MAG: IclR family transcriptional regulator [Pseudolysinimonas sp.]
MSSDISSATDSGDDISPDNRSVLDKVANLLSAFGDDARTGLGLSELARRVHMSKSTAYRILGDLERTQVVDRVGQRYMLNSGTADRLGIGTWSSRNRIVGGLLTPFLIDLHVETSQTVHLAALEGVDVVYLNKLYGHRNVSIPTSIGGRAPSHATAVGKCLLAYDSRASDALANELPSYTSSTVTDRRGLELMLRRVRATGRAEDHGEFVAGIRCIAVPVFIAPGRPIAAMSVVGPAQGFDFDSYDTILRVIARNAGRAAQQDPGLAEHGGEAR